MALKYKSTIRACFLAHIVQAVVNNFIPLLFLTFQSEYDITLAEITSLITINFVLQLCIDFGAAFFIDKIGYRAGAILAHAFAALGLIFLTFLPDVMPTPYIGLIVCVCTYAVGGGLTEVLISPIVEACPSANKKREMSMLHSFYCWGCVTVVVLSTLFFVLFGIENWKYLAIFWAALPIANGILFIFVPLVPLVKKDEKKMSIPELLKQRMFWVFVILMLCAGAAEQSVYQWASTFAEKGLNVTKTIGDLAGPLTFAIMMGISRTVYAKLSDRLNLKYVMLGSGVLAVAAYALIAFAPISALAFVGFGLCGLAVGVLWPGTYSTASETLKGGGTSMFALLALAGDLGCTAGPTVVGFVSDAVSGNLSIGIIVSAVFPLLFVAMLLLMPKNKAENAIKKI